MISTPIIYRAPPNSGSLSLGRTLPSLLDEACDRTPNQQALNQWRNHRWQSVANTALRTAAEEVALGLIALGLQRGDRVAFVLHSDVSFCVVDLGCLLAGLVDVPIDLTQTIENILYILQHSDGQTLVVSNLDLLYQLLPYLNDAPRLRYVVVAEVPDDWATVRANLIQSASPLNPQDHSSQGDLEECLHIPQYLADGTTDLVMPSSRLSTSIQLFALEEIKAQGRCQWSQTQVHQLRTAITPSDLATILYIAGETKRPRGVMLSHENISANILAAFSSYPNLETGDKEVALIFLPLTHIFARAFLYGHLSYGHSIYFSDPNHVVRHLKSVNPTILITVPRLLEKVYERILDQGQRLSKFDRTAYYWALKLAHRYRIGMSVSPLFQLRLKLADRLVFSKWRAIFGDRMKALICGGAALRAELANVLTAAGIPVLQGYGLTETSAVLCYNRGAYNRAGTVGQPIPGVEIAIATDGEILVKSPFIMQGYYRDPLSTQHALTPEGWLHTGDLGEVSAEGFLTITGVKKSLFKLATGKYVSPLPLEHMLVHSSLVDQAIAVGANQKFCGMLIVPNGPALYQELLELAVDPTQPGWLHHPCVQALYQALIDTANCHLPYWSTVRKFRLIQASFTVDNGLLLPDGTVNRAQVLTVFATEIAALYEHDADSRRGGETTGTSAAALACPSVPDSTCPIYARSLMHY